MIGQSSVGKLINMTIFKIVSCTVSEFLQGSYRVPSLVYLSLCVRQKTWLPFTRSLNGCGDYTPAVFDCHQGCLSRENEERTRERLISSGINTIQPRVHIDFTQSRLVVIAASAIST